MASSAGSEAAPEVGLGAGLGVAEAEVESPPLTVAEDEFCGEGSMESVTRSQVITTTN